jgi:hypothetical protein
MKVRTITGRTISISEARHIGIVWVRCTKRGWVECEADDIGAVDIATLGGGR